MLAINPSFGADEAQKQAAGAVQFPAGSYKNPAVLDLKGVKDYSMLESARDEYLRKHYDGYRVLGEGFTMIGGPSSTILTCSPMSKTKISPPCPMAFACRIRRQASGMVMK